MLCTGGHAGSLRPKAGEPQGSVLEAVMVSGGIPREKLSMDTEAARPPGRASPH